MAFNYSPKIVADGLVLYLDAANPRSYASGSTSWLDLSRSGYRANITSPAFTSEGGGGFTSGTTYMPAATQLNPTQLTFEVTLRIVTTVPFTLYGEYGDSNPGYSNKITLRGSNGGNGLQVYYYGNTTTGQDLRAFGTYNVSTTKILAVTFDNLGTARSYINGVFAQSITTANFTSWQIATNPGVLFADYYANLKIYNRALSAQEIQQNYNALKGRYGL